MAPRSTSRSTDPGEGAPGSEATTVREERSDGLIVGRISAPHGVRGEVRVEPETDVAERFARGSVLQCDGLGTLVVSSSRGTPAAPILAFEGYQDRAAVEPLRGRLLRVSVAEARRAAAGAHLWSDLVGLRVERPSGEVLGTVVEIIRAGETDVLVVRDDGDELLLPALESVIRAVDREGGRIVAQPQEELST